MLHPKTLRLDILIFVLKTRYFKIHFLMDVDLNCTVYMNI